jgi:hemolysin activation/secretion protein
MLHGYNIEEIFARRFLLVNLAYRFPIWPDQDRVHLQLLADYAWVDYLRGHRLPRSGLAGVGANLSFALTKRITLAVGYGYGIDAPRHRDFGGHEIDTQFEVKY